MRSLIDNLRHRFPLEIDSPGDGGIELNGRQARSATTVHGPVSAIVGLPFVAVGLAIVGVVSGVIDVPVDGADRVPPWLIGSIGAVFAWAGLSFVAHGVRGVVRNARVRRIRAAHPEEPWRWDHEWDDRGATDDTATRAGQLLTGALFMLVFLTPFHWIGFVAPDGPIAFGLVALLFDAVALAMIGRAIYLTVRRLKYGAGRALFTRFPFRRGEELEMYVIAPRSLPQHAVANATLRCVQEKYVTRGRGENASLTVACFEIHRDTAPAPFATTGNGARALRIRFPLPRDLTPTDLASRPCRYWEVEVGATTDGVDYSARFLVPVY